MSVTTLPWGRSLTAEDLAAMPDDGHRYELIDGALIVTPSPSREHQLCAGKVYIDLVAACPDHLRVAFAPLASIHRSTWRGVVIRRVGT